MANISKATRARSRRAKIGVTVVLLAFTIATLAFTYIFTGIVKQNPRTPANESPQAETPSQP